MFEPSAKRAERLRYLETLYKMVDGSPRKTALHNQVLLEAGLTSESGEDAFQYLLNEGLIIPQRFEGVLSITHRGVKECESALRVAGGQTSSLPGESPVLCRSTLK